MVVDSVQFLSTSEVAKIVGKSPQSVRRAGDSGSLDMMRDEDGNRWFNPYQFDGHQPEPVDPGEHEPLPDHGKTDDKVFVGKVHLGFTLEHGAKQAGISMNSVEAMARHSLVIPWGGLGGPKYSDETKVNEWKSMMAEYKAWLADPASCVSGSNLSTADTWRKFANDRSSQSF